MTTLCTPKPLHALLLPLLPALLPALLATTMGARAVAQPALLTSTGVAKGSYSEMYKQLATLCGAATGMPLAERNASGSLETLDRLLKNQVHLGMVQADVLHARQLVEDLQRVKALLVLNPEELHLVALREPPKQGGFMGLGQHRLALRTLADLAGRRVAAWGGGVTTARLIQLQGELNYSLVEVAGPEEALDALRKNTVDAVLAVGGAPLPWLSDLPAANFKLLPVLPATAERLKNVYRKASISYPQLSPDPVPTMATDAVLVTQDYRSGPVRQAVLQLRQCVVAHLDTLQSTVGNHPKWQQVNPQAVGSWPSFAPLPDGSARPNPGRAAPLYRPR